jgi:hypothetical protein
MRRLARKYNPYQAGGVGSVTFVVGAEGSDIINVALTVKDENGKVVAARQALDCWLAIDTNGTPLRQPPNTSIGIGTNGALIPKQFTANDGVSAIGTLAIDAVPEKFKTTTTATYKIDGKTYTKNATTAIVFTAAHVVTASKFGVVLVQINAAGTVSTKVPSATQAYNSAVLALAALPQPDAGNVALGYIAIANNTGDWTANTDDLTNGSDLTTATFVDVVPTGSVPLSFTLVTSAAGLVDVNIKDTTDRLPMYLVVRLPDGSLNVSGAINFA